MPQTPTSPAPSATPEASGRPPLGVGLIGYGYAGATLHAPLITTTPGLALRAVASRQAGRVQADLGAAVAVVDVDALLALPTVDIVVIASPNPSHAPLAAAALAAGKHVVIDKPMALEAAQAQPLLALAADRGLQLSVFHNRRWDGDFLTAQALLADGEAGPLGRLTSAQLQFDRFRPQVRDRWREGDGPGAGLYMDLAPHLIDQALQLFGPPLALAADIACLRPGGRSPDQFALQWRCANGLRVGLSASMLAALPGPRFALHGTRGSWVKTGLDRQEDALKAGQRPDPAQPEAWGDDPMAGVLCTVPDGAPADEAPQARAWPNRRGRWPAYYAALRDAVHGLAANPVPPQQALAVLTLMDLGLASARRGRWLDVPAIG